MVNEQKLAKLFSWALFLKNNHNLKIKDFMLIYCMPKYMAWSFHYNKKGGICYIFIFLIDVAPLRIKFLNFGNS
jgi:hypothetical protein